MAITDNRSLVSNADALGSWVDETGGVMGVSAASNSFITGTGSIEARSSKSTDGVLWDFGSTQDLSNTVMYIWVNMTAAALLAVKTSGGMTMRFAGPTITDFFEIYIGGSDTYGGGWKMFVVDASVAKTTSDNTGGTAPAVTAVQFVGIVVTTTNSAPGADPNLYIDSFHNLAAATPGIIVAGQNGGAPWTMQDVIDAGDVADTAKAWGTIRRLVNGTIACNTPIQFGLNDATQDEFEDTNEVFGWEANDVPDGFYGLSILAGAGQADTTFGIKTGTGDDATGAQGFVFTSGGPRWFIDFNDANADSANFYGCNLIVGEDFLLDSTAVSVISSFYINCNSALISNSEQLKVSVINANTADGVAFMTTDDFADIVRSNFEFSDGHAIELTTPRVAAQVSKGNKFTGYDAIGTNDAAVYNNTSGAVTITITDTGDSPTYRNGTSASTVIIAGAITIKVTAIEKDGTPVQTARVILEASDGTGPFPFEETVTIIRSGSTASVTHASHGMATGDYVLIRNADQQEYNIVAQITVIAGNEYDYTVSGTPTTPATGTIDATFVALYGTTDVNGEISTSRVYPSDQPATGRSRKSTSSPFLQEGVLTGTIDSATGYDKSAVMVPDE